MIYKILSNKDGVNIFARIDDDGLCRVTCTEQNPEFMAWVAEGNSPYPADSATPLPAENQ